MANNKPIAILGGMGPQATGELYRLLIEKSAQSGAGRNDDYPEIFIDSVPVPDFISDTTKLAQAKAMLIERIERLNLFQPACLWHSL